MKEFADAVKTKVSGCFDVIAAGGGVAGISAALAAARQGAQVLLLESSYILGGLATSGLVTIFLPLCDGMGRQVSFGICEELIRLSVRHTAEDRYPAAWFEEGPHSQRCEKRFEVQFNPHLFALETERLLLENGVQILYGTKVCGVKKHGNRVEYIIIENKSGRCAIKCRAAVDCTGDAELFDLCGVSTAEYAPQNVLAGWYYYFSKGKISLRMLGVAEDPDAEETEPLISRRFSGIGGGEISEMTQLAHEQMLKDIIAHRKTDESYVPVTLPSIPQLRMTRRIRGTAVLDTEDAHTRCASSVGMISNWKKRGPVYEVPFETLFCSGCENMFAAGRCISVTDSMWDVSRVIPACAVTGEAAGTAAAMLSSLGEIDVTAVQNQLVKNGVVLHEEQLGHKL